MKFVATIIIAALLSSCATVKAKDPFRNPDGSLNIPKILQWAKYGIDADCLIPGTITSRICSIGGPALEAAQAAADHNPTGAALAAAKSLQASANALPPGDAHDYLQYIGWAINRLLGASV